MPEIHAELERRAKEARGEVYVSPEEADRIEAEKAAAELEASRIADLKEKCAKKGLNFEEEAKYQAKQAKKKKTSRSRMVGVPAAQSRKRRAAGFFCPAGRTWEIR